MSALDNLFYYCENLHAFFPTDYNVLGESRIELAKLRAELKSKDSELKNLRELLAYALEEQDKDCYE